MHLRRTTALALALAALAGCTKTVSIAPISVPPSNLLHQLSGRYVAWIGPAMPPSTLAPQTASCGAYSLQLDFWPLYEQALRGGLSAAFQHIDFVPAPLSPTELRAQGYRLQFAFETKNIFAGYGPTDWLQADRRAALTLSAAMTVSDGEGVYTPRMVSSMGTDTTGLFLGCGQIDDALSSSVRSALTDLVQKEVSAAVSIVAPNSGRTVQPPF